MNAAETVDWWPAVVVLAAGLVVGAVLIWRALAFSRNAGRTRRDVPVQVRDLAGKHDALLRQLRELEDTASKRTPEQLARERYSLELEAAGVLLALDRGGASAAASAPSPAVARRRRRRAAPDRAGLRGFLWGTGTTGALLTLGFLVYQSAKPREPGGSLTGASQPGSQSTSGTAAAEGDEAGNRAAIAGNPDDIDARLALAEAALGRRDFMALWNEANAVLQRSPENARALAYQALVRVAMGQPELAIDLLKKALATDPALFEGYAYLALAYLRTGRTKESERTIAQASRRFPDRAEDVRRLLAALQEREPEGPAAGAGNPHARVGAPGEAISAAPAAAASGRRISGTVDLDPSLKGSVPPGAVLFVFVRNAGAGAGPPVAAKRFPPTFPAAFELSEADSMMGQPFPDPLLIEARLDEDGDPTTRPPTDPKARLDRVKAGRSDLRLILKRQ